MRSYTNVSHVEKAGDAFSPLHVVEMISHRQIHINILTGCRSTPNPGRGFTLWYYWRFIRNDNADACTVKSQA